MVDNMVLKIGYNSWLSEAIVVKNKIILSFNKWYNRATLTGISSNFFNNMLMKKSVSLYMSKKLINQFKLNK